LIIFLIGLKDDMISLDPLLRFVIQTLAASLVVILTDLRIDQLQGAGLFLTIFFVVGIVNAINLIDGIDGLAASLGVVLTSCYAILFFYSNEMEWALISFSLTGALTGFLFYNFSPSKIFMGNSGSYLLGFFASILSIKVINIISATPVLIGSLEIQSGFAFVLSILIIPVFDTIRVITLRIMKGKSPLKADRNHIHHRLLLTGLSHSQVTLVLILTNFLIISLTIFLQTRPELEIILIIIAVVLVLNGLFSLVLNRQQSLLKKESGYLRSSS
jgi:UDP-GlcNAc:undecaprenyl-phosphate GlcNAc-1-phosphate transferase